MLEVIPFRPGVVKDDPAYTARGYATDSDKIRWVRGYAQPIGDGVIASADTVSGTCCGLVSYGVPLAANPSGGVLVQPPAYSFELGIGTTRRLYVMDNRLANSTSNIYDITPIRATGTLPNNPFTVTNGSPIVTVAQANNNVQANDFIYIANSTAVGGITPGGPSGTYANNPFTTFANSTFMQISHTAHGMSAGDILTIAGSTAIAGGTPSGAYHIFDVATNVYWVELSYIANASAVGGGAVATFNFARRYLCISSDLVTQYQFQHTANATSGATGGGASVSYSYGINGGSSTAVSSYIQPFTWSLDHYGALMVACPRNGTIYKWALDVSQPAIAVTNAPAQVLQIVVTPERFILACGCTSVGGTFDPLLIRWPDQTDITQWTPAVGNLAGSLELAQGSQVIAAKNSKAGTLIWTDYALYLVQYTGNIDGLYQATLLGTGCGAVGPNAVLDHNGVAFWVSPDYQFYIYDGGTPRPLPCPCRTYFADNQFVDNGGVQEGFNVFAFFDTLYSAVSWLYPAPSVGATGICNSYIRLDIIESANDPKAGWSIGTFDRTAWLDARPFPFAVAVSSAGVVYDQDSNNGFSSAGKLTWAPVELPDPKDGNGTHTMQVRRIVADLMPTSGTSLASITLNVDTQMWPNGPVTTKGPYSFSSSTLYQDTHFTARQITLKWSWSQSENYRWGDIRLDVSKGPLR